MASPPFRVVEKPFFIKKQDIFKVTCLKLGGIMNEKL